MNLKEARKELKRVGTRWAEGDALRAMYADLIAFQHGGKADRYFKHLQENSTDDAITAASRELLSDRSKAWDVLMGQAV